MNQRLKERYEIAFGLRPRSELKAWEARYNTPAARSGSYYKSLDGLTQSQRALGYHAPQSQRSAPTRPRARVPVPPLEAFHDVVTNHAANNATVELWSTGRELTAGGMPVTAIKAVGTDRYGAGLVELETAIARYTVEQRALHLKD